MTPKKSAPAFIFPFMLLLSVAMHWNIFSKDIIGIHDWRQSQTQLNIRYFTREDPNILNPRVAHFNQYENNIYRYEFPVMQWSIAMVQRALGESILITRICVFIIGALTLLGFYRLLIAVGFSSLFSSFGAWALSFSPVFYYYIVNPMPDNLALGAGIWYLYFFVRGGRRESLKDAGLAAFFLLLATLAKLPFIIFGAASFFYVVHGLLRTFRDKKKLKYFGSQLIIYPIMMLPALLWYLWVIPGWEGNGIVEGILNNQLSVEAIREIWKYHYEVMFPYKLMNPFCWLFFIVGIIAFFIKKMYRHRVFWLLFASFFFVLLYYVFEFNMIGVIHDYYMFPFLPFLFLIITYGAYTIWKSHKLLPALVLILLIGMPVEAYRLNKESWTPRMTCCNSDLYVYQTELQQAVPTGERCIVVNDHSRFVFMYALDKEGYVFFNDHLPSEWIEDLIERRNIKYMYSTSRVIDENPANQALIDTMLLEVGTIRVFKLKKP